MLVILIFSLCQLPLLHDLQLLLIGGSYCDTIGPLSD